MRQERRFHGELLHLERLGHRDHDQLREEEGDQKGLQDFERALAGAAPARPAGGQAAPQPCGQLLQPAPYAGPRLGIGLEHVVSSGGGGGI